MFTWVVERMKMVGRAAVLDECVTSTFLQGDQSQPQVAWFPITITTTDHTDLRTTLSLTQVTASS